VYIAQCAFAIFADTTWCAADINYPCFTHFLFLVYRFKVNLN
jgi:hypothetical protein